jgi:aminopeptidase N
MYENISPQRMRGIISSLLLLCLVLHGAAFAQPIMLNLGEDPTLTEPKIRMAGVEHRFNTDPAQKVLDIKSMDLDISIDIQSGSIVATAIKRLSLSSSVANIRLQLSDVLDITSIRNISGNEIPFQRMDRNVLVLAPQGGFSEGDHTIRIGYSGKPQTTGLGSFNFSTRQGKPIVWTLSQPFGARDWFPTTNNPSDKLDSLLMRVTVPKPLMAISNGILIGEQDQVFSTSYTWKHRYPISVYLISLAIAEYDTFDISYKPVDDDPFPIVNYVYKGQDLNALKRDAQQTVGLMDLFWNLYGPYPFKDEKYGHAQYGFSTGGMEHQTISSMGNLGFFLVAHELAHQWFGNKVTNATWSDLWIQEGMATLSEGLPLRYFLGEDDFRNWLRVRREQVLTAPSGSVYIPEAEIEAGNLNRMFDTRLTYRKAAWVLNMLRVHVGDESFFAGLRSYLAEYAYSAASTEDFRRTMEAVSGKSLGTFFDQWVYGEGYPVLNINYRPAIGAPNALRLDIRHVGSHRSVPVFEFHLDVRLSSADRDTILTVHVTQPEQTFVLEPGFAWSGIVLDPEVKLLFRQESLTSLNEVPHDVPSTFRLEPGYPNPFNPTATIPVYINQAGLLNVDVVDLQGRVVQRLLRADVQPGVQRIRWDATGLRSGVYLIRARMESELQTIKMTVLR